MADIHDRWVHAEQERDTLRDYLINDIVRMSLLMDPNFNTQEASTDMFYKPAKELADVHARVSQELEGMLQQDNTNKNVL